MPARQMALVLSAAMAAAIQEGRKTTFRAPVTPQPINVLVAMVNAGYCGHPDTWLVDGAVDQYHRQGIKVPQWSCPYGVPGDRLYVQEPWNKHGGLVTYLADGDWIADYLKHAKLKEQPSVGEWPRWEDADAMPEEHARLVLEIVSVQAKPLQAIDPEQAAAEGMFYDKAKRQYVITEGDEFKGRSTSCAREAFYMLWESMRTGYMWKANPWVWVVEFKLVSVERGGA